MFDLQRYLDDEVPLTRAMGIRVARFDAEGTVLAAPLAANFNDKKTAFAGSLAAILSLAAWAVTRYVVDSTGAPGEIVIVSSEMKFSRPIRDDFEARCDMPDTGAVAAFVEELRQGGKARWTLPARVEAEGKTAANFAGTFVAWKL